MNKQPTSNATEEFNTVASELNEIPAFSELISEKDCRSKYKPYNIKAADKAKDIMYNAFPVIEYHHLSFFGGMLSHDFISCL